MTRSVQDVFRAAAIISGLTVDEIKGRRKSGRYKEIRWAVLIISREMGHSYSKISRVAGRDHTSVLYALKKGARNEVVLENIALIREQLKRPNWADRLRSEMGVPCQSMSG